MKPLQILIQNPVAQQQSITYHLILNEKNLIYKNLIYVPINKRKHMLKHERGFSLDMRVNYFFQHLIWKERERRKRKRKKGEFMGVEARIWILSNYSLMFSLQLLI
jgi:hypothetical protein